MKNIELLENKMLFSGKPTGISPIYHSDGQSCCVVIKDDPIYIYTVFNLIKVLFSIVRFHDNINKIVIVFLGRNFDDKLTYVLLECYLDHILSNYGLSISIVWENNPNIFTFGMINSPLQLLCSNVMEQEYYSASFRKSIGKSHYRRVFYPIDDSNATQSVLLTDLSIIFKQLNIPTEQSNSIAEVAVELVGNALEHSQSDCFLDIDITNDYVKKNNLKGPRYFGVNICVINFSPTLLSSQIEKKICQADSFFREGETSRYWKLKKIYNYHKDFFDSKYSEKEFFMLSAFQDNISGRPKEYVTGGRGLPMLIKSLEQQAEVDNCYVISGDRKMRFIQGLLEYDDDHWIGMNQDCNFADYVPDPDVFSRAPLFFPGTAYNLNFVIPRGINQ